MDVQEVRALTEAVMNEVGKVLVGKRDVVVKSLVALYCGGHILIEGVPGIAKTTLARAISAATSCSFARIQFLPDLMPSDIIGLNTYIAGEGKFVFKPGPIFGNIILADEINRASPKTQSALLEVMEERQVTVDRVTYPLERPFSVIATQNPFEFEGIFPLPEAQLDRFMLKLTMTYPTVEEEQSILRMKQTEREISGTVAPVATPANLCRVQEAVGEVHVSEKLITYISNIVARVRSDERTLMGASPRGSITLLNGARAYAAIQGRDYLIPEDVRALVHEVLDHRVMVRPEYELEGTKSGTIVQDAMDEVPVPR